jgi:hypothetical protein
MNEFNTRIAAQRHVLQLVNQKPWKEELFGLSKRAIQRWRSTNQVDPKSNLSVLIEEAASRLFCLATKSQEQVTEEYGKVTAEFTTVALAIEQEVR